MRIPDKLYEVLKWLALIALPAIGTFLLTVLPAVGVPLETATIIATVVDATGILIGTLIGVSTAAYRKEQQEIAEKAYEETDER